jgi:hypothetical protein
MSAQSVEGGVSDNRGKGVRKSSLGYDWSGTIMCDWSGTVSDGWSSIGFSNGGVGWGSSIGSYWGVGFSYGGVSWSGGIGGDWGGVGLSDYWGMVSGQSVVGDTGVVFADGGESAVYGFGVVRDSLVSSQRTDDALAGGTNMWSVDGDWGMSVAGDWGMSVAGDWGMSVAGISGLDWGGISGMDWSGGRVDVAGADGGSWRIGDWSSD